MTKLLFFAVVQVLLLLPVFSFAQEPAGVKGQVAIIVHPVFNGQLLKLNEQVYVNEHGDTLSVDMFRFYISRLRLGKALSKTALTLKDFHHLVDAENIATCSFTISIPEGDYDELSFVLGVDSIANTSGANDGDLDPIKGMYWAWNTGYIMAKIEGRSKVCHTLHNAYEFHIGGYLPPNNAVRQVALRLPRILVVRNDGPPATIHIKADVAAWFKGIDLAKTNNIVIPGKGAMEMADRYMGMFSLE
ncbi:MAG: MbnP family protein [Bacteroidota bacterium]